MKILQLVVPVMALASLSVSFVRGQDRSIDKDVAEKVLLKAVTFFRKEVGFEGTYVYRVSSDLKLREGEGKASRTTGWVEPPGTAFVGEAFIEAYRLTGEKALLEAALEVADALAKTQLESGGWSDSIELKDGREKYRYRSEITKGKADNYTTLDDNKTQSCLRFLMHLDEQLPFENTEIRGVVDYAFDKLLPVQYPNGAWPQKLTGPPVAEEFPILKAVYPESWSREFPKKDYRGYYTLNDGTISDMLNVMLEAHRIYGDQKFLDSAKRTGYFLLLAQMPEPQPGWAQQYNSDMAPAWARKFEPPAISGGESQGVLGSLLNLYEATGDQKYLEPFPSALKYYKASVRPDGKMARFYELQTNKPLYFTRDYKLTYSDSDMPTHYGFVLDAKWDRLETAYMKLKETPVEKLKYEFKFPTYRMSKDLVKSVQNSIDSIDQRGAWVEKGSMSNYDGVDQVIESKTFARRIRELALYLSSLK